MTIGLFKVYLLELEDDGSPNKRRQYIRLPPPIEPYILRISIDGGAAAVKGAVLYTNYPIDKSEFHRQKFHAIKIPSELSKACTVDIAIECAGAYAFYLEFDDDSIPLDRLQISSAATTPRSPHIRNGFNGPLKACRKQSKPCYFNVDPILRLKPRHWNNSKFYENLKQANVPEYLPLDGVVIESVISKCLGPIESWEGHFALMQQSGYNMVHFTPIQQRGESNSPYSIFDQLVIADDLFTMPLPITRDRVHILETAIDRLENKFGILSLTDVVWNHTANNSDWLQDHPEAGYNVENSPHLEAALELDTALIEFSENLSKMGYATTISSISDLDCMIVGIESHVLRSIRLWEYYVIDVEAECERLTQAWKEGRDTSSTILSALDLESVNSEGLLGNLLSKIGLRNNDRLGERFRLKIDLETAIAFMSKLTHFKPGHNTPEVKNQYTRILNEVNMPLYEKYDSDKQIILDNIYNRVKYMRLDDHGPKLGAISERHPLVEKYFTRLPLNDRTRRFPRKSLALANNGWIWNANPLVDFAGPDSRAYLRREVIVWGDCVKLRYGSSPESNPWLWKHMQEYTDILAKCFHGFRIDNCHSTPIHVGEYFLDSARRVRPDLYVVAELFTGSEEMDLTFVSRLGINSLIREAMQAWDPKELSRLVHRYGGKPIGSMDTDCLTTNQTVDIGGKVMDCLVIPLQGSQPHALFMDCTHDNEVPNQKRTAQDTLANGALVAMSNCAIGSVRGYDEIFPSLVDLVNESRKYQSDISERSGILHAKKILNKLHCDMAIQGFVEEHVHQENDYILVHRVHPQTHKGYFLVARCAFQADDDQSHIAPIRLDKTRADYIFGASLIIDENPDEIKQSKYICGLKSHLEEIESPRMVTSNDGTIIHLPEKYPGGSIMLFGTVMDSIDADLDEMIVSGADQSLQDVDLVDLNAILFRSDVEEKDVTDGYGGSYSIPNFSTLVYCGLQGWISILMPIMVNNDLGHPVCDHLRQGTWALDYVGQRIERQVARFPNLRLHAEWLMERFDAVKAVPNFMIPKYFSLVINTAYRAAIRKAMTLFSDFVKNGDTFTQSLALCSVQMYGHVKSASLHPIESVPCVAAGLPHFAFDYMRCWGRDVFLSLRGLFLVTGNYDAARRHILSFASTLKHGMIPNLLDSNRNPRYNSRDSPWWFCQAVQDYTKMAPEGDAILNVKVRRRFPLDDTWVSVDDAQCFSYSSTLAEIVQEILQRHASGIHFREWNAGPQLDSQMSEKGFDVDVFVDWKTGFVFGGNQANCGTWMDKMGESEKAGTKGIPGTPRDGAAIEIIGLLKSTLRWVAALAHDGKFAGNGVEILKNGEVQRISYTAWGNLIQKNFEKCFYIPGNATDDGGYDIDSSLVNRRAIYKDLYRSGKAYEDYQLRPNFAVAMCVAPELFNPLYAFQAIEIANDIIRGPLGMRTLDPSDLNYRGYYENSNDSDDPSVAKGRNYHQGPEWVWCIGYFLRAYLFFETAVCEMEQNKKKRSVHRLLRLLHEHKEHIRESPWVGLPELTNANGQPCHDSCPTQAWSASTILDFLWDIDQATCAK